MEGSERFGLLYSTEWVTVGKGCIGINIYKILKFYPIIPEMPDIVS